MTPQSGHKHDITTHDTPEWTQSMTLQEQLTPNRCLFKCVANHNGVCLCQLHSFSAPNEPHTLYVRENTLQHLWKPYLSEKMSKHSPYVFSVISNTDTMSIVTISVVLSVLLLTLPVFLSDALRPNAGHGVLIPVVSRSQTTTKDNW